MKAPRVSAFSLAMSCLFASGIADAQENAAETGTVRGQVIELPSKEAVIEGQVTVVETHKTTLTDIDGNYSLKLPPGVYTLRFWAELKEAQKVGPVTVVAGKTTTVDVKLGARALSAIAVQEVVVVAKADKATESAAVTRRQKATAVSDSVTAEQISRGTDSVASDAVKRVVSATVQDNKYVVVRGLAGRYSSALLNGVPLPSPDPDAPTAPLDLFPAALLASLTISKTYTPNLPGTFAGGTLLVETREFPSAFNLRLRLGLGGDSVSTLRDHQTHTGGSLDALGYDDGGRALPAAIPRDGALVAREGLSQDDVNAIARSFNNTWSAKTSTTLPNLSLAATAGDTLTLSGKRVGYLASLNFNQKNGRRLSHIRRTDVDAKEPIETRLAEMGTLSATLGSLANIGLEWNNSHRFALVLLYSHSGDQQTQTTRYVPEGQASSSTARRTQLRFLERALTFAQLTGEHKLGQEFTAHWQANLSTAGQNEPDTRDTTYISALGAPYAIAESGAGSADRFFAKLNDTSGGAGLDLSTPLPFKESKLRLGGAWSRTGRRFSSRRFRFDVEGENLLTQDPEDIFAPENLGAGVDVMEVTRFTDGYKAHRDIGAGYAMVEIPIAAARLSLGARYEATSQDIQIGTRFSNTTSEVNVPRDEGHLLPAANVLWQLTDKTALRGAYSLTVARPSFRELSPVLYYDFSRNRTVSGNPDLVTTRIHNADLRVEYFPAGAEVLSATAFFKSFADPIESTFKDQNGDTLSYVNTPKARAYGVELEAKAGLGRLTDVAKNWTLGSNFTWMQSEISLDDSGAKTQSTLEGTRRKRPLQGQAPYILNVELAGRWEDTGIDAGILYNVAGRRISEVGVGGSPDGYEMPFHRVDASVAKKLGQGFRLKATATNLLNERVQFKRRDVVLLGYLPGVAGQLNLEWQADS